LVPLGPVEDVTIKIVEQLRSILIRPDEQKENERDEGSRGR